MIDSKDINFEEEMRRIYEEDYIGKKMSLEKLAKEYGHDASYYSFYFKRFNLTVRDNREKNLKYTCDSNYFEKIDTEEKAYWLGFLYADGYITSARHGNNKKVGLSLSIIDRGHLEKFNASLKSNAPVHEYTANGFNAETKYARVIIVDPKLAEDLISLGVVEHKTDILTFPDEFILPKELRRHFIRGYFDGDGSINCENNPKHIIPQHKISFCGTDNILESIMNELIKCGVLDRTYELGKRRQGQIVSRLDFGGNRLALKFCEYLYKDATIWLDRKYDKYIRLLEYVSEIDSRKKERICCVCNSVGTSRTHLIWHGDGEYNNKIVCRKHYGQLRSRGMITSIHNRYENLKDHCEICGDTHAKLSLCGIDGDYKGMTLCKKHYDQVSSKRIITDPSIGWHKH